MKEDAAMRAIDALASGATPENVRIAIDACVGVMGPPAADAAFAAIAKLAGPLDGTQRAPALIALRRLSEGDRGRLAEIARLTPPAERLAANQAAIAAALMPSDDGDVDAQIDRTLAGLSTVAALEPAAQGEFVRAFVDALPAKLTPSGALRVGGGFRALADAGAHVAFMRRLRCESNAALVVAATAARAPEEIQTAWAGLAAAYEGQFTAATVFHSLAILVERAGGPLLARFERAFPDLHSFHDQVSEPLAVAWARAGDPARGYLVASSIRAASARLRARLAVAALGADEGLKARLALDLAEVDVGTASWVTALHPQQLVGALGVERSLAFVERDDLSLAARAAVLALLPSPVADNHGAALFDSTRGSLLALSLDDLFALVKPPLSSERTGALLRALLTRMLDHDPKSLFYDDWEGHDLGALAPLLARVGGAGLLTALILGLSAG